MARYSIVFLLALLSTVPEARADSLAVWADPACPGSTDAITVTIFLQSSQNYLEPAPLSVAVANGVIHVVAAEVFTGDVVFGSSVNAPLGVLPIGTYSIEAALRVRNSDGTLGPEMLQPAFDLVVGETSRACTPASSVALDDYLSAPVGGAFTSPLRVQLFDKEQRPVPGAVVNFERIARPEEGVVPGPPIADATLSSTSATTDDDGVAQVTAIANGVIGTYQIRATVLSRIQAYHAVFVLSNRGDRVTNRVVPVVEYGGFKFFYTSDPDEMRALDNTGGWFRTGAVFLAFPPGSSSPALPTQPVCRYMWLPAPYSHFFSLDPNECALTQVLYSGVWMLEADNAFEALAPDPASGGCAGGTIPLFRLFATENEPNIGPSHRFTDSAPYQQWLLDHGPGYVPEGAGPGVAMCVLP